MLSSIPDLDLDVFEQMEDFFGVPNDSSRNLLENLEFSDKNLFQSTPQEYIMDE